MADIRKIWKLAFVVMFLGSAMPASATEIDLLDDTYSKFQNDFTSADVGGPMLLLMRTYTSTPLTGSPSTWTDWPVDMAELGPSNHVAWNAIPVGKITWTDPVSGNASFKMAQYIINVYNFCANYGYGGDWWMLTVAYDGIAGIAPAMESRSFHCDDL